MTTDSGAENPPEWAFARAVELAGSNTPCGALRAFAHYIAAHEDEPVDPLLIEAREICAEEARREGETGSAAQFANGSWDDSGHMTRVLVALKRGIELATKP